MKFIYKLILVAQIAVLTSSAVNDSQAQELDVPVIEHASDDLDTCSYGQVTGLKEDGDGFLAVRSGPGSDFTKLDELHNEDKVWLFEQTGEWIGIVYDTNELSCSPIFIDREVPYEGKKGWVHQNWIEVLAG